MYRIVVTGSRSWTDREAIRRILLPYALAHPEGVLLVHGGAWGADRLAGEVAHSLGMTVAVEPVSDAEWRQHGKRAGHLRNGRMLAKYLGGGIAGEVVGFRMPGISNGTDDCIRQARHLGLLVTVVRKLADGHWRQDYFRPPLGAARYPFPCVRETYYSMS